MYIIRDIFYLQYGRYKEAKALLDSAYSKGLLPDARSARVLTDFTGTAYRLIFEEGYQSLEEYKQSLQASMKKAAWKKWYEQFKVLVRYSEREILKVVL